METDFEVERDTGYAVKVGARLRSIRRQKHLSLQDVEAASEHEFKASVLGAYERGERAISVPRLQRLARFYRVPVDQMLPSDDELGIRSPSGSDDHIVDLTERTQASRRDDRPVTIDLGAVDRLGGQEGEMLSRYLRMIQVQRGDYNGRMLTIRREDLRAVACILDCHPDQVPARLDSLGLCLVR
ncbi:MAG TPA: transcriptional regulator [Acidimicrobiales bacterium]|nr:transcriptional regulator [Acidimicrobiales bacterium]